MKADFDDNGHLRSWWPHREPEPSDSSQLSPELRERVLAAFAKGAKRSSNTRTAEQQLEAGRRSAHHTRRAIDLAGDIESLNQPRSTP